MPADISIREQREAVEVAARQAEQDARDAGMSTGVFAANLYAAAITLAKVERGELVPSPIGFGEYSAYCCTCGSDTTAVCPIHGMQTL